MEPDPEALQLARRRQRNALLLTAKTELDVATQILAPDSDSNSQQVQVSLKKLTDYRSRLAKLDTDILVHIVDEEEATVECQGAAEFDETLLSTISLLSSRKEMEQQTPNIVGSNQSLYHSQASLVGSKVASVKLPKLELDKFHGDPLKWAEFWDSYSSTIHDNDELSDVDKFKYLRSFLDGDALSVIGGYMLTSANYQTAVEALCGRFGNKQLAIFAHFEALLTLPTATHEIKKLQHIYDECEKHIRSLVALGLGEETFGQVFTPIILSKLPLYVKMELHRKNGSDPWDLSKLREWLREEIRARDYSQRVFATSSNGGQQQNRDSESGDQKSKKGQGSLNKYNSKPMGTTAALVTNDTQKTPRCCLCNESHFADQCQKYPTAEARKEQIVHANRCFKCLSNKHPAKDCPSTRVCVYCRKTGHHRCICRLKFGSQTGQSATSDKNVAMTVDDSSTYSTVPPKTAQLIAQGERAILQTALAKMKSHNGQMVQARILFDTGCSRSFITTDLSRKIQTVPRSDEVVAIAGFGDNVRKTVKYKTVEMEIYLPSGGNKKITANVTNTISCPVQKLPLNVEQHPVLAQLKLADPPISSPEMVTVDILIGTDYYYDFIGSEQLRLSNGVILLSSILGYIATGKVQLNSNGSDKRSVLFVSLEQEMAGSTFNVEKFWRLEDIGVKEPAAPTNDDDDAVESFNNSVKLVDGRYHVDWPWKRDEKELPDNYHLALGRLKSLKKKLDATPEVLSTYNKTIQDQLEKGIIEKVPEEKASNKVHYIPHHCVITPTKTTTKLRVVYDASAKASKHSPSINECLNRGPILLDNLCGLILKFRCHTIGMVSDIEKAFLQVGLHDTSRDVTRFLWLKDPKVGVSQDNLIEYRFCRVPFGYNSSPFMLAATVYHHVETSKRPAAADVKGNMYVDNLVNGKETVQESKEFYFDAKGLFKDASMNLREWFTNNDDLRATFAPEDRGKETVTKVLGLSWNTAKDSLSTSTFNIQMDSVKTKRQMLSNLAKVFDPCGYYSPLTITGKMLIQKLWKGQHGWDDALPKEIIQEWNICASDLMKIAEHSIPRRLFSKPINADTKLDLHCFSDASGKAYGACIYLVRYDASGSESALVFAKSRVAPVKELTIPRLELMAVLIGVRSIAFVTEQLKLPIHSTTLWSDSQCVLHWLSKTTLETRFVKNRIDEIKEHRVTSFRYVPTQVNPADLISRGCSYQQILENDLWWRGPDWIVQDHSKWPANIVPSKRITSDIAEQEQPITLAVNDSIQETQNSELMAVSKFSSLLRLLRVTAWMFRFIKNLRRRTEPVKGCLQSSELAQALKHWEISTQKTYFQPVIHAMETKTKMPIVKQLNLVRDDDGRIRSNKRLDNAAIAEDAKKPILLPKNSEFTRLVIKDCHCRQFHAGVSQTLANSRLKYHIIHGRSQVKYVLSKCRQCRMMYGGPFMYPLSPNLPKFRVDAQKPFQFTGVDYMGPLYIKDTTHSRQKVWICLFTCAAIRAVHLEVVTDLSAQQFLLCLRRFISQCDKPQLIISDNAKQLHASEQFLSKVLPSTEVQDFAASEGIQWKFVTERAPWMGGFYERMVGIVKKALKTSLDRRCVTLVELQTVASEVSSVVNSRPITYVGTDDTALTPSHFLKGVCLRASSFSDVSSHQFPRNVTHDSLNSMWRRTEVLLNSFWQQWKIQYLLSLRTSFKFKNHNASSLQPLVGGVVIVKDDLPRASWRLGKIVDLVTSQDGKVRTAVVQLPNRRRIKRAIRLLFPLEIPLQSEEQSDDTNTTQQQDDDNASVASVELILNESQ